MVVVILRLARAHINVISVIVITVTIITVLQSLYTSQTFHFSQCCLYM